MTNKNNKPKKPKVIKIDLEKELKFLEEQSPEYTEEDFGEKGVDYATGGIVKVKKKKKKMKKPRGVGAALRGYGKACS